MLHLFTSSFYSLFYISGFELTYSNIISFLKEENFSSANAEDLGVHLNIPWSTMKTLKSNNVGNANSFLYDVIGTWLDLTEPSVEEFAKALAKCGYKKMAGKIQGKHSIKPGVYLKYIILNRPLGLNSPYEVLVDPKSLLYMIY